MLGFTHADLKKSVFYQEVFAEGHQESRQIRHLKLATAERLAKDLLDFQTLNDLAGWLDAQADPSAS